MNIQEFLEIAEKEHLGHYCGFIIGDPFDHSQKASGDYDVSGNNLGVYQDETGVWRTYLLGEKGSVSISPKTYTEDGACKYLLERLRNKKDLDIEWKRKNTFPFCFFHKKE